MTAEAYWQAFLQATGRDASLRYFECFAFGLHEALANELLELVLAGQKRATSSSLRAYEIDGARTPQVGDFSIVTDWAGNPRCIIETTAVTVLPFSEMTYEICKREGEDDTLESWQEGHRRFFTEEGKQTGFVFTEDMPVIFEDFRVVYAE